MLQDLLTQLRHKTANFADVIRFIEERYTHEPTAFRNGDQQNAATENQGSAKVLAFAQAQGISAEDTLVLFGEHYSAVLANPEGSDHQNIRQFMQHGWAAVSFEGTALQAKGI